MFNLTFSQFQTKDCRLFGERLETNGTCSVLVLISVHYVIQSSNSAQFFLRRPKKLRICWISTQKVDDFIHLMIIKVKRKPSHFKVSPRMFRAAAIWLFNSAFFRPDFSNDNQILEWFSLPSQPHENADIEVIEPPSFGRHKQQWFGSTSIADRRLSAVIAFGVFVAFLVANNPKFPLFWAAPGEG